MSADMTGLREKGHVGAPHLSTFSALPRQSGKRR
jgi:hypothetical protein